jgi:hypothetical protein
VGRGWEVNLRVFQLIIREATVCACSSFGANHQLSF